MLDGIARKLIGPAVEQAGRRLAARGIGADAVTWTGFALGLAAFAAIWAAYFHTAALLVLASRLCDGLDGAVARHSRRTDRGGFLDIVLDFAFYGLVPLGFVLADPARNAVAGAVLLFSFYVNGASFLAYAVMAEKRRLATAIRGEKSLYFTAGLAEATETLAAFLLACLAPAAFPAVAYVFAAMTLVTAGARVLAALRAFG
ncbi:CDP-alcohol phosphatidyltransferase family protein [Propylenella binzhouense]|uniref:CDP-alcohol phosphatidyltransferase family protein n=1 Tax=Propylenella binzhouense TaxID=2555902 RepID=A0A964T362_9HYPH|nr:CDP-alcohol phosphatidyltransferase family protein [Propylenella binzhouense]MYZ47520.1 CDP-alcohol phosphatidyltransferase family protein [Propylenella binzhouense]